MAIAIYGSNCSQRSFNRQEEKSSRQLRGRHWNRVVVEAADDDSAHLLAAVELIVVGEKQRQIAIDSEWLRDQVLVFERVQRQLEVRRT